MDDTLLNIHNSINLINNKSNFIADPCDEFKESVFINLNNINKDNLLFTRDSIYSSSKSNGSKRIIDVIYKHMKTYNLVITDGTANIGTDSINLSLYFNKINSIELSIINYYALKNNVNVFNLNDKINIYNGDTNILIKNIKQDVIYIDAPWGGPEYKQEEKMKLYLGETEILDFYEKNKENAKLFIFKVPFNYDFEYLHNKIKDNVTKYSYKKATRIKYFILAINNL